jgi:2-phospho-L-lactate/phosphoenolpyruvate guanylyltransferase
MTESARVAAIVPVASIEGAKTRLGESLDAEERHDLVSGLLERTLAAVLGAHAIDDVLVVSPDRDVLTVGSDAGARTMRQRSSGLNDGIRDGRADVVAGAATAVVVVPLDLPFITAAAVDALVDALTDGTGPTVLVVPDRHGSGTNILGLRPPDVIDVSFGIGSREAHRTAAIAAGAAFVELDGPLTVDLDTPDDLVFIDAIQRDGRLVG